MRTKEFIKRVEELEFIAYEDSNYWLIKNEYGSNVAHVNKTILSQMSTDYIQWDKVYNEDKEKLFDLLVEYAETPPEDREEIKKYSYKHNSMKTKGGNPTYLAIRQRPSISYPLLQGSDKDIFEYKVEFTDEEIKKAQKEHGISLDDFEKNEVKDDQK